MKCLSVVSQGNSLVLQPTENMENKKHGFCKGTKWGLYHACPDGYADPPRPGGGVLGCSQADFLAQSTLPSLWCTARREAGAESKIGHFLPENVAMSHFWGKGAESAISNPQNAELAVFE